MRRYIGLLPSRLVSDYGHRGPYTPEQVESAMRRHRVGPARYTAYAVALFCGDRVSAATPQAGKIADLREELGVYLFGSSNGFSYSAVQAYCSDYGAHDGGDGGVADCGDAGGGHH